mgnify:CR=1 FL=1
MIAFAAAFWLLREAYAVVMPAVCALLLALAVWPLASAISERMPSRLRWLGAVAGLLVVLFFLGAFVFGIGLAGSQVYDLLTDLGPRLEQQLHNLGLPDLGLPDILSDGPDPDSTSLVSNGALASSAMTALGITTSTLGGIVLILFLILLMLLEAGNWHDKIAAAATRGRAKGGAGGSGDRAGRRWLEIGRSVGEKFRAYFLMRLVLGTATACLYAAFLAIFGVDYLLLWAVLTVLLGFIPTVGSIVSGALPVFYVLVTRDPGTAALVALGLLVIEQVMGNFVDPRLMGKRLSISPLVVLLSLLFWSVLWGVVGAILAVPLTVLITMVMAHFDGLKPAALLLTDRSSFEELDRYIEPKR